MTYGKMCAITKERVRHALNNQLFDYEDEHGNDVYKTCTKKEAEEYILSTFDSIVHEAIESMHSGRALEYILKQHGHTEVNLSEYENALHETEMERDYHYEHETALDKSGFTVIQGGKND